MLFTIGEIHTTLLHPVHMLAFIDGHSCVIHDCFGLQNISLPMQVNMLVGRFLPGLSLVVKSDLKVFNLKDRAFHLHSCVVISVPMEFALFD